MTNFTDRAVRPPITLRIHRAADGRYEVRNGDSVLGTTQVEMLAAWNAVTAAEELAETGSIVRVVSTRNGIDNVEFVAVPKI
jgi:hypothetical protein